MLGLTIAFASFLASRIAVPVRNLAQFASGLAEGRKLDPGTADIAEIDEVRAAFENTIAKSRAAEQHVRVLMRELAHRSKNQLAIVQSIARQTARTTDSVAEFSERFNKRLLGLASSHDLLLERDWQGVHLGDLVRRQLSVFKPAESGRLIVRGDVADLTPAAAEAIGLALHELATNAVKYGAWSNNTGKVVVEWTMTDGGQSLKLSWRETGGPVVAPPTAKGFGSLVIESIVEKSVKGKVTVGYGASGFTWMLDCPMCASKTN